MNQLWSNTVVTLLQTKPSPQSWIAKLVLKWSLASNSNYWLLWRIERATVTVCSLFHEPKLFIVWNFKKFVLMIPQSSFSQKLQLAACPNNLLTKILAPNLLFISSNDAHFKRKEEWWQKMHLQVAPKVIFTMLDLHRWQSVWKKEEKTLVIYSLELFRALIPFFFNWERNYIMNV